MKIIFKNLNETNSVSTRFEIFFTRFFLQLIHRVKAELGVVLEKNSVQQYIASHKKLPFF